MEIGIDRHIVPEALRHREKSFDFDRFGGPVAGRILPSPPNRIQHILVGEPAQRFGNARLPLDEAQVGCVPDDHEVAPQLGNNRIDGRSLVGNRQRANQERKVRVGRGADEQAAGLVAIRSRSRTQPRPGTRAGAKRLGGNLVRLGHGPRLSAGASHTKVRQLAGSPRLVEPQLSQTSRWTIVDKVAPGEIVDVAFGARHHESRGNDRAAIVFAPVVKVFSVHQPP